MPRGRTLRRLRSCGGFRRSGALGHLARERRERLREPIHGDFGPLRLELRGRVRQPAGDVERSFLPRSGPLGRLPRKAAFLQQHVPCALQSQYVERRQWRVGLDRRPGTLRGRSGKRCDARMRCLLEHLLEPQSLLESRDARVVGPLGALATGDVRCQRMAGQGPCGPELRPGDGRRTRDSADRLGLADGHPRLRRTESPRGGREDADDARTEGFQRLCRQPRSGGLHAIPLRAERQGPLLEHDGVLLRRLDGRPTGPRPR